jgi:hypothetical protein
MLRFERHVVEALGTATDQPTRSAVEAFVDGSLRAMPGHVRAAVIVESLVLGAATRLGAAVRRPASPAPVLRAKLQAWQTSPIGPLRQYVRVFRSLVLFSENELAESHGATAAEPTA